VDGVPLHDPLCACWHTQTRQVPHREAHQIYARHIITRAFVVQFEAPSYEQNQPTVTFAPEEAARHGHRSNEGVTWQSPPGTNVPRNLFSLTLNYVDA